MRSRVLHRLTVWGINTGLGIWVVEALLVLVALILMGRGGEAGRAAARAFDAASGTLLAALAAAIAAIGTGTLVRHALHAEPLAPFEYTWLSFLLAFVLFGSTLYILLVGAPEFDRDRILVARMARYVRIGADPRPPREAFDRRRAANGEVTETPDEILQAFKEASETLFLSVGLGAASAMGLLVLHYLGWREARAP